MTLYIKTTTDEFELPECVADSAMELAKNLGLKVDSIYTMASKGINGYHKVVVDDLEE